MSFNFDPFWVWLILGLAMLALELVVPFTFFLWLGVSALTTAATTYLVPLMNWQSQCLIFSVLSVLGVWLSRRYLVKQQTQSDLPYLNQRAHQYIGRVFTLTAPIENGYGKISVDDSRWQVKGPAFPKGAKVKVVGCEGVVLIVDAVEER